MKKLIALIAAIAFVAISIPSMADTTNINVNAQNTATANVTCIVSPFACVQAGSISNFQIPQDQLYQTYTIPSLASITVKANGPYTCSATNVANISGKDNKNVTLAVQGTKSSFPCTDAFGTPVGGTTYDTAYVLTATQGQYLEAANTYGWAITWTVVMP